MTPTSPAETESYIQRERYLSYKKPGSSAGEQRQTDTPSYTFKLYKLYQDDDGVFALKEMDEKSH